MSVKLHQTLLANARKVYQKIKNQLNSPKYLKLTVLEESGAEYKALYKSYKAVVDSAKISRLKYLEILDFVKSENNLQFESQKTALNTVNLESLRSKPETFDISNQIIGKEN
jgi:hypothetical protein